jgi:predicted HTH domain antitoxin
MQITLELPDEIARELKDLPRALLESFALEGYRSGKLTEEQIRKILGCGTRMQVDGFLKEHGVYLNSTLEDLDRDTQTSREFSSR